MGTHKYYFKGQSRRDRRVPIHVGMMSNTLEPPTLCAKCGRLTPNAEMHKGWCLSCVSAWVGTVDPWLIYQAQGQLPSNIVPKSLSKRIEELQERVTLPIEDDEFLPLTQFMGWRSLGNIRSMWNFLQALYTFEVETTAEAARLGVVAPNTTHLCGRHAPVVRAGVQGYLSRISSAGDEFKLWGKDKRFTDYIRGFQADNKLWTWTYQRTSVNVYDREKTRRFVEKFGHTHFDKHSPTFWPFEANHETEAREKGTLEELPDFVMEIGEIISATKWPASVREDLCQDLVVAVLSDEVKLENLRTEAALKHYIQQTFKNHPLRYGRFSLDAPMGDRQGTEDSWITLMTQEDVDISRAKRGWIGELCVDPDQPHGWHDGRDRQTGIATLGDVARSHNDGHAIQGPDVLQHPESEMDEDIAEVFYAEQNPKWRRRLSD